MAATRFPCQGKGMAQDKDKLAEALRENLRKRKAQAREMESAPAKAGAQTGEADKR